MTAADLEADLRPACETNLTNAVGVGKNCVDRDTAEALILEHLTVVDRVVGSLLRGLPPFVRRDDLRSAGLAALVTAAQNFDPTPDVPFDGFAAAHVRWAVLDELRHADWPTRAARRQGRLISDVRARLVGELDHTPTVAEVAAAAGLSVAVVTESDVIGVRTHLTSLDEVVLDGSVTIGDLVPGQGPLPGEELLRRERLAYLADAVASLSCRPRLVVEWTCLQGRPDAEAATELGISEARVGALRRETLGLLRHALTVLLDEPNSADPAAAPPGRVGVVGRRRAAYVAAVAARRTPAQRLAAPPPAEPAVPPAAVVAEAPGWEPWHGTNYGYCNHACRCAQCRESNRVRHAIRRQRARRAAAREQVNA